MPINSWPQTIGMGLLDSGVFILGNLRALEKKDEALNVYGILFCT